MLRRNVFSLAAIALIVSACGGGGGGGGSVSAVRPNSAVPFTSFSAIQPNQTVQASGISQTATFTTNSTAVVSSTINPVDTNASNAQLSYDAAKELVGIALTTPGSSVSWSGSSQISCDTNVCTAQNGTSVGYAPNALGSIGWNYQTYGVWITETSNTTGVVGVISVGNPTASGSIPVSGAASYSGITDGVYVDSTGGVFLQRANMTSKVNFAQRSIGFSTNNTVVAPLSNQVNVQSAPQLDLNGTLTYAAGVNQFSGAVSAVGTPGLSGTANGRFYGPGAEEIGGILALSGAGQQRLLGAFGGKR